MSDKKLDLDRVERILRTMEKEPCSKEDLEYINNAIELVKNELLQEDFEFPEWMEKTLLGYVLAQMIRIFIIERPLELVEAYLYFQRSKQGEKEHGRD